MTTIIIVNISALSKTDIKNPTLPSSVGATMPMLKTL